MIEITEMSNRFLYLPKPACSFFLHDIHATG